MRLILPLLAATSLLTVSACASEPAETDDTAMADTAMADSAMADTTATPAAASGNSTVGGAEMFADKPIAVNAAAAPNLTTLVSAVTAAGLGETLSGAGPFTVFAPTNDAFAKVDKATLTTLMKPESKAALTKVLTYHVVAGKTTAAQLMDAIKAGGGKATLKTVAGENLTATMDGDKVKIAGMGGSSAYVSQADVMQSNGVVHVVDGVLTPTM